MSSLYGINPTLLAAMTMGQRGGLPYAPPAQPAQPAAQPVQRPNFVPQSPTRAGTVPDSMKTPPAEAVATPPAAPAESPISPIGQQILAASSQPTSSVSPSGQQYIAGDSPLVHSLGLMGGGGFNPELSRAMAAPPPAAPAAPAAGPTAGLNPDMMTLINGADQRQVAFAGQPGQPYNTTADITNATRGGAPPNPFLQALTTGQGAGGVGRLPTIDELFTKSAATGYGPAFGSPERAAWEAAQDPANRMRQATQEYGNLLGQYIQGAGGIADIPNKAGYLGIAGQAEQRQQQLANFQTDAVKNFLTQGVSNILADPNLSAEKKTRSVSDLIEKSGQLQQALRTHAEGGQDMNQFINQNKVQPINTDKKIPYTSPEAEVAPFVSDIAEPFKAANDPVGFIQALHAKDPAHFMANLPKYMSYAAKFSPTANNQLKEFVGRTGLRHSWDDIRSIMGNPVEPALAAQIRKGMGWTDEPGTILQRLVR